ncbi:MAG: chemotaxis protein CheW, partial [Smithellaceae bacterium]
IIPVVSLRLKFGLEEIDYTDRTCIIVVEVRTGAGSVLMGTVVDEVSEVLNIRNAEIEDTPAFGTSLKTDFILGMAKAGNRVKILLDIDKVISGQEMEMVLQAA